MKTITLTQYNIIKAEIESEIRWLDKLTHAEWVNGMIAGLNTVLVILSRLIDRT